MELSVRNVTVVIMTSVLCAIVAWPIRVVHAQIPLTSSDSVLSLLRSKTIRSELELVDEQIAEINELYGRASSMVNFYAKSALSQSEQDRKAAWAELHRKVAEHEAKGLGILLPHQRKRLDQVILQIQSRSKETAAGLTHKRLAEQLKLSGEQSTDIREEEAKLQERLDELNKEVARLKEEARAKVLSNLTAEQRARYHDLLGEPIEIDRAR